MELSQAETYQFTANKTTSQTIETDLERGGRNLTWSVEQSIKDLLQNHLDAERLRYRSKIFQAFVDIFSDESEEERITFDNENIIHNRIIDVLEGIKNSGDNTHLYNSNRTLLNSYSSTLSNCDIPWNINNKVKNEELKERLKQIEYIPPKVKYIILDKSNKKKSLINIEEMALKDRDRYKLAGIRIYDNGSGYDPNLQIITGESLKKADPSTIGQYGEGLKVSAEYMQDKGFKIRTYSTNPSIRWLSRARFVSNAFGTKLAFNIHGRRNYSAYLSDTTGSITDIQIPSEFYLKKTRKSNMRSQYFNEFTELLDPRIKGGEIGDLCLQLGRNEAEISKVERSDIEVIKTPQYKGRIYSQSILLEKINKSLFAYNLSKKQTVLGRDRNHVSIDDLTNSIAYYFSKCQDQEVIDKVVEQIFSKDQKEYIEINALSGYMTSGLMFTNRDLWIHAFKKVGFNPANKIILGGRYTTIADEQIFRIMHGYTFKNTGYNILPFIKSIFPNLIVSGEDLRAEIDHQQKQRKAQRELLKDKSVKQIEIKKTSDIPDGIEEYFEEVREEFLDIMGNVASEYLYLDVMPKSSMGKLNFQVSPKDSTIYVRDDFKLTEENKLNTKIELLISMAMLSAQRERIDYPTQEKLEMMILNKLGYLVDLDFDVERQYDDLSDLKIKEEDLNLTPNFFANIKKLSSRIFERPNLLYKFEDGECEVNILENGEVSGSIKFIKLGEQVIGIYKSGKTRTIFDPQESLHDINYLLPFKLKFVNGGIKYKRIVDGKNIKITYAEKTKLELDEASIIKGDTKIITKISDKYTQEEGRKPVTLRELLYNAYDAEGKIPKVKFTLLDRFTGLLDVVDSNDLNSSKYSPERYKVIGVNIEDNGQGYSPAYLRSLGKSTKANNKTIGEFGEGLKEAILNAVQENFYLKLSSQDWEATAGKVKAGEVEDFVKKTKRDINVLAYDIEWNNKPRKGSRVDLSLMDLTNRRLLSNDEIKRIFNHPGLSAWEDMIRDINPFGYNSISNFFVDENSEIISKNEYIDVLDVAETHAFINKGTKFAVNGAIIAKPTTKSILGYNFKLSPTDSGIIDTRTRTEGGTSEARIKEILKIFYQNLTDVNVIEKILKLSPDDPYFIEADAFESITNPNALKAWREAFNKVNKRKILSIASLSDDKKSESLLNKLILKAEDGIDPMDLVAYPEPITELLIRSGTPTAEVRIKRQMTRRYISFSSYNKKVINDKLPLINQTIYKLGNIILNDPTLRSELVKYTSANKFKKKLNKMINGGIDIKLFNFNFKENEYSTQIQGTGGGTSIAFDLLALTSDSEFNRTYVHELMHVLSDETDFKPGFIRLFVLLSLAASKLIQEENAA